MRSYPPAEAAIDPAWPIVDPHHHFSVGKIDCPPSELAHTMASSGHNIISTVYVECGAQFDVNASKHLQSVGETRFAANAMPYSGKIRIAEAIIGYIDLTQPVELVREALAAHQAASRGRLRGIRQWTAWHPLPAFALKLRNSGPAMLGSQAFRAGFAELAKHGLSFDAWVYDQQLDEVGVLANDFPEATIILDHVGTPVADGRDASVMFSDWRDRMTRLARHPNVIVKLGGLGMPVTGLQAEPTSVALAAIWRPYIDLVIDLFGAHRCCFESNFPVDRVAGDYGTIWNAFKRITANRSTDERHDLFAGTAIRTYRLSPL